MNMRVRCRPQSQVIWIADEAVRGIHGWALYRAIRLRVGSWWLAVVVLACAQIIASSAETGKPRANAGTPHLPVSSTNSPWSRIIVVGASASAGFTDSEMLGGPNTPQYRLSRYLDAALYAPHPPIQNLANTFFFANAEAEGQKQINRALKASPSLLVGVDFLFWFCYGPAGTEQERAARFEKGLKMLEPVRCPLILGDVPDASAAVNGMLSPEEIPTAKAMAAANQRLKKWAADRRQTVIVPLGAFMRTVLANEAFTVHGQTIPQGRTQDLLQPDQLHPTPPGAAVLALVVLDAVQSACPGIKTDGIRWNPKEVFKLGFNRTQNSTNTPAKPVAPSQPAPN